MTSAEQSILIVGGGIFGITAGLELRRRAWRVTVVDAGDVPAATAASTDISKVVRMDYGADELYTEMAEAALDGWDRWNAHWDRPLYHEDGFLLLSGTPLHGLSGSTTPSGFEQESLELLRRRGHSPQRIAGNVTSRFPAWSSSRYPDGYFSPRAGWVESGLALARVARDAREAGVEIVEGDGVVSLLESGERVEGVRTLAGRELRADVVLVAAGAWTPTLLPYLADVMWATGQPVLHLKVDDPREWQAPRFPVWAADISRTGWYGFPALDDGTMKIGHHGTGRRVHPDEPRTVLPSEVETFVEFLRDSLPPLASAPVIRTRLCLYCDTFDGDFWIDHDPHRPGLVVAAGDSGHGFKFAPVLGGLIADVVERKPNPWAERFRWRTRGALQKEAARATTTLT